MLELGTKAPAFTLPDQNGEMRSLADLYEAGLCIWRVVPTVPRERRGGAGREQGQRSFSQEI